MNDIPKDSSISERAFSASAQTGSLPAPTVDEYREYLDEFEITEEQKAELLQTLWWIMVSFADIGWGVDSVQRCLPSLAEFSSEEEADALQGTDTTEAFNGTAVPRKDHSP